MPMQATLTTSIFGILQVKVLVGSVTLNKSITLRKSLPFINASPSSCSSLQSYQSSHLRALADWSNGTTSITDVEVTPLAQFVVDSSSGIQASMLQVVNNKILVGTS
jgi:hypothetical protein